MLIVEDPIVAEIAVPVPIFVMLDILSYSCTSISWQLLKVVSLKRRRKCTLKSYDRFTNS